MYWEKLEGAFTFQVLYSNMVQQFNNANFVEIGTWKGRSAVYMAEKIKESRKNIKFWTIDLFTGIYSGFEDDSDVIAGSLLKTYYKNIEPVKDYIQTLVGDSIEMHKNFKDESIDFLFIDGDHSYEGVKKDLKLWFPKIKNGGIIAGHDYEEPSCGVKKAVDEFFIWGAQSYIGGCWIYYN